MEVEVKYMERALQLARNGYGHTSPNPMVGAVIVCDNRIIGEGYHRKIGGPHAEVWAVRSVAEADRHLLPRSVMYVTLEPCSHYGKTPPCARLIIEHHIGKVVVGCTDPNPNVSGRGIAMLREAGIEVEVGVLENECRLLNRKFMVAQTHSRPYVMLKWAQSADGFTAQMKNGVPAPVKFSTSLTSCLMHRERASVDAIMVGRSTVIADNPSLSVRFVAGQSPRPVIMDRSGMLPAHPEFQLLSKQGVIYVTSTKRNDLPASVQQLVVSPNAAVEEVLQALKQVGVSSLMVEGGATLLGAFVESGLWDDARIEVATNLHLTDQSGYGRVKMPIGSMNIEQVDGGNVIINVKNDSLSCNL